MDKVEIEKQRIKDKIIAIDTVAELLSQERIKSVLRLKELSKS